MTSRRWTQILQRAALSAALFFSFAAVAGSTETYKDIIDKAHNLSLQKDRTQSVSLLVGALKKEGKKSPAQKELAATLNQVAKVFYGDKSQQLYELALSLKTTDPNMAVSKLQEASRMEVDNISTELALVRMSIFMGDCDGAYARVQKQKELFPYVEELRLALGQAQVCLGKLDEYLLNRAEVDTRHSPLSLLWQTLETEYLVKTGNFQKARELSIATFKAEPKFPESHYWAWKSEVEIKMKADSSGQKYLNACKALNSRLLRQYMQEPQLCHRTPEVENFLKKNNNSEI